ncbi:MAG: T9SS C-terminal target domain-containing protein [Cytophagales bacterium]|nr:MAG: T9SS C-terminal target domain-containing protein [Cytophagales bacterium]
MFRFTLLFIFLVSFVSITKAKNTLMNGDTSLIKITKGVNNVLIKQLEKPVIVKRGENLIIEVENPNNQKIVIRLHTSLGRLVREYGEVEKKIIVSTQKFLPGLYLIIIKKQDQREVRKVLVTD